MTGIFNSLIALIPFALLLIHAEHTNDSFDPVHRSVSNRYRGFFALVVILHHMAQRVTNSGLLAIYYDAGYTAVAMFFFYSGYGTMKKGIAQKERFFRRKLPALLIPYLLTMGIYWIIYALTGDVKSLGGLFAEHFNNASGISFLWYVFAYLFWVLFLGIALRFIKEKKQILYASVSFACWYIAVCIVAMPQFFWIYDTVILIPCGCAWAYYEDRLLPWIHAHYRPVLIGSAALFGLSCLGHMFRPIMVPSYFVSAVSFMVLLNTSTMKHKPNGKALNFLGNISYELYILHGIPVTFLRTVIPNEALWTLSVLLIGIVSAWLLHEAGRNLWRKPAV